MTSFITPRHRHICRKWGVAVAVVGAAWSASSDASAAAYPPASSPEISLDGEVSAVGGAWYVDVDHTLPGDQIDTVLSCDGGSGTASPVPTLSSVIANGDHTEVAVAAPDAFVECTLDVSLPTYGVTASFDHLYTIDLAGAPVHIEFETGLPPVPPTTQAATGSPTATPSEAGAPTQIAAPRPLAAAAPELLPKTGGRHLAGLALVALALLSAGLGLVRFTRTH